MQVGTPPAQTQERTITIPPPPPPFADRKVCQTTPSLDFTAVEVEAVYDHYCKVVDRQSACRLVAQAVDRAVQASEQPGGAQHHADTCYLISNVDEDSMNGRGGRGSHWFAIAFSVNSRGDDGGEMATGRAVRHD